jgi:precorrin-6B methylase 2
MAYAITCIAEIVIIAGGVWILISIRHARKIGAPFYPASDSTIRAALKAADLRPGDVFYDLGAGTGNALLIAGKEFGARTAGFEISPIIYWIGKINLALHRSHASLIKKDLFKADLHNADVIFCFLAIRTMQKMEDKIKTEAKPGARIIVYAFPLPTLMPEKTIIIHGQWKIFFYRIV